MKILALKNSYNEKKKYYMHLKRDWRGQKSNALEHGPTESIQS